MRLRTAYFLSLFLAMSVPAGACTFPDTNGKVSLKKPVDGLITIGFGMRLHPILMIKKMHTGVDYSAKTGTPVHAAAGGEVVFAGYECGYGNLVLIKHGPDLMTAYGHLQRIRVKVGDCVEQSAHVGDVGSTGLSEGPKLHFEVRKSGAFIDPLSYIAAAYEGDPSAR